MKTKTSLPYTLLASLLYPQVRVFLFERFLLKPVLIQTFLGKESRGKINKQTKLHGGMIATHVQPRNLISLPTARKIYTFPSETKIRNAFIALSTLTRLI